MSRLNQPRLSVSVITFCALMVALNIIFGRFLSVLYLPHARFSLAILPILLTGIYLGPILGFVVGVVADVVGMLISGVGLFHPGITFTTGLRGVLPGLIMILWHHKRRIWTWLTIVFADLIIASLLLQSLWFVQRAGATKTYWAVLLGRVPNSVVLAVAYFILLCILVPVLDKVLMPMLHRRNKPSTTPPEAAV